MFHDISNATSGAVVAVRTVAVVGVVLHTSDGRDSRSWLQGGSAIAGRPASADYLIARGGDVYRLVRKGLFAYHAGQSQYSGLVGERLSEATIGIELENYDSLGEAPLTPQYDALGALLTELRKLEELPPGYFVVGHGNVATPCGRRCDPVRFNWARIVWPR